MKRFLKALIKMLFYAITGIAIALWILSASSLNSESMMPTVVCALSSLWLWFAASILSERGQYK